MEIYTGYVPGGVSASICGRSPDAFGTRTTLSNYAEETILRLERICINGGKRGFLVAIQPPSLREFST